MIKPAIGSIVQIAAYYLKPGMTMIENGESVKILEVEIDMTEQNAVSYVYEDANGKAWAGYGMIDTIKHIEYAAGINLVNLIGY